MHINQLPCSYYNYLAEDAAVCDMLSVSLHKHVLTSQRDSAHNSVWRVKCSNKKLECRKGDSANPFYNELLENEIHPSASLTHILQFTTLCKTSEARLQSFPLSQSPCAASCPCTFLSQQSSVFKLFSAHHLELVQQSLYLKQWYFLVVRDSWSW